MVTRAWKEKDEKELEMKLEWLKDNGYDEVDIFYSFTYLLSFYLE